MKQVFGSNPAELLVCIAPSLGPDEAEFIHFRTELPDEFWNFQSRICRPVRLRGLRQSLRQAVTRNELPSSEDVSARASLILHFVLGRWQRYAKSGWKKTPSEHLDVQLGLLLAA